MNRCCPRPIGFSYSLLTLAVLGCGSAPVEKEVPQAHTNLRAISLAYGQATNTLSRPPRNKQELLPFLTKQGDAEQLLRSPVDGEEIVIVWGADIRIAPPKPAPVIAYEKVGKNGKR